MLIKLLSVILLAGACGIAYSKVKKEAGEESTTAEKVAVVAIEGFKAPIVVIGALAVITLAGLTVAFPLTIPALILSAGFRVFYTKVAVSALVSTLFMGSFYAAHKASV